ncbi:hypothetical protein ACRAWF_23945 [Streptomyces sp. L7]
MPFPAARGERALDAKTLKPAFPPYFIKKFQVPGAPPVKVAVLGLTNPGIAIWDKAYVQGKLTFPGLEEQAGEVGAEAAVDGGGRRRGVGAFGVVGDVVVR